MASVSVTDWEREVSGLYERRASQIWQYCRRLGLDTTLAEDVAQETFTRLLGLSLGRRPEQPEHWIFRTAHNLCMDQHRRHRRQLVKEIPLSRSPDEDAERRAVWKSVDRLPQRQRAAVYLRYQADLDFRSIASVMGISESGARANVFRALAQLREWMVES